MTDLAIKLTNISKKYLLHHEKPTLVESLFRKKEIFWALKNINLEIKKGDKLGIIGPNGAGKSTLLKIIAGITTPTEGKITTDGRISSLIDLQAGFHPDLTGEENIYLYGLLLGLSQSEIKANLKKIVRFSGLGKFIDAQLFTYSSGMKLRLGFSVIAHSQPEILIIDEAITAGDEKFRQKSLVKMQGFFGQKKTILFVSHHLGIVKEFCPRILWLEKGRLKTLGPSRKVISEYLKSSQEIKK
ncbi:MAG: ABC transporter ATP-binding protein [Candidatus Pacebacteria bacterium]|nr:ABC transporter ATP-binding protein [Candidatus Paceibacterota bacterium]